MTLAGEETNGRRWIQHDKEHEAAEKAHEREHQSEAKAVDLAVDGMERRLDELNQLRKEVVIDRSQYLTISTWDAEHKALKVEMRTKGVDTLMPSLLNRIMIASPANFEKVGKDWQAYRK